MRALSFKFANGTRKNSDKLCRAAEFSKLTTLCDAFSSFLQSIIGSMKFNDSDVRKQHIAHKVHRVVEENLFSDIECWKNGAPSSPTRLVSSLLQLDFCIQAMRVTEI